VACTPRTHGIETATITPSPTSPERPCRADPARPPSRPQPPQMHRTEDAGRQRRALHTPEASREIPPSPGGHVSVDRRVTRTAVVAYSCSPHLISGTVEWSMGRRPRCLFVARFAISARSSAAAGAHTTLAPPNEPRAERQPEPATAH